MAGVMTERKIVFLAFILCGFVVVVWFFVVLFGAGLIFGVVCDLEL